jgi:phospholipase/carboxylesterase
MNTPETQVDRTLEARINLYYDFRPVTISPAPLLIALHGYGANKQQMMREAQLLAPEYFAIASLQGFHQHIKPAKEAGGPLRFGFGWFTNFHSPESIAVHHQAIRDLIKILAGEGVADPARVFLLGFSQSCALNYRFAFTYPEYLRGAIGICGGIPGDWETSPLYRRADIDVMHLAGTRDELYPPERVRDYEKQLKTRARSVEFKSFDAAHEIVPEMRSHVVQWLAARVSNER